MKWNKPIFFSCLVSKQLFLENSNSKIWPTLLDRSESPSRVFLVLKINEYFKTEHETKCLVKMDVLQTESYSGQGK